MAGPTVAVLTPDELSEDQRLDIWHCITGRPSYGRELGFWIDDRPFFLTWGEEYEGELYEFAEASGMLGWAPRDMVGICAECNGDEDHRLLAELCATVLMKTGGVVAFDDVLSAYTDERRMLTAKGVMTYQKETLLTSDAFALWRTHPDFRMVK